MIKEVLTSQERIKQKIKELKEKEEVIPAINDSIFKGLFQSKECRKVLSFIISYVVDLNEEYVFENLSFKNVELTKENKYEKGKITDLLIEIKGTIINLEMNQDIYEGTIIKNNGYHHKLAGQNLLSGENFEDVKRIIQINFDYINKFDDRLVVAFRIMDETGKYILDKNYINYHINMAKVREKGYNIDNLSKFEKIIMIMQEKSKKKLLEIAKGEEDLKMMVRKIEELSEDPEILGLYDKEKVDKLVFNINMEQCRRESTAQGLAEGKAQGLSEGLAQGKIETAKNMLKKEMDINLISEITGLSKEEIETLN